METKRYRDLMAIRWLVSTRRARLELELRQAPSSAGGAKDKIGKSGARSESGWEALQYMFGSIYFIITVIVQQHSYIHSKKNCCYIYINK